mgnify:FL=1
MAISRSLMNRQLQANGGIMQVAPREKFGLGSSLKKFVRKIIPNEVADIAVKAAPFVAPFNPAVAAAMSGLGTFDQTGSISAGLKSGAMNYGGGQLARYAGGAGFQGNPFGDGGAFTGGLQGFKGGFSSPIGKETGLGKFFSNRGTDAVQGINSGRGGDSASALSRSTANAPTEALASEVSYVPGGTEALASEVSLVPQAKPDQGFFSSIVEKFQNKDYSGLGREVLDKAKEGGKALFTKPIPGQPGKTQLDKAAVFGAIAFTTSYAEAKALAAETGVDDDLTEAEYDELKKADKQEEYAGYLTNFFGGKKDGGRIGFKFGTKPDDAEVGIMTIDVEAGDDEEEENDLMAGITFSSAEKSYLFRKLGGAGGSDRSFTMPQLYRVLSNPDRYAADAAVLKEIAIMGLGKKDGGRIGYKGGANRVSELLILRDQLVGKGEDVSDIEAEIFQLTGKTFRSVGGISDLPTGQIRKNNAGVVERDYRDEGGFVPVGIKERADDVPAMLSKNEFVMTADAVRGIGNGSVEEGSKKLYNTMKQAEKVGKA